MQHSKWYKKQFQALKDSNNLLKKKYTTNIKQIKITSDKQIWNK